MTRPVHLHIDTLVLDGIDVDGRAVARAAERELARLIAAGGLPDSWREGGAHPALGAAPIALDAKPNPRAVGTALASSVLGAKR